MQLSGKNAIVTGSAVGVGRATALALAKRGANVVVNYSRSEDEAKETVAEVERYNSGRGELTFVIQSQDNEMAARLAYARNAATYQALGLQLRALTDSLLDSDFSGEERP